MKKYYVLLFFIMFFINGTIANAKSCYIKNDTYTLTIESETAVLTNILDNSTNTSITPTRDSDTSVYRYNATLSDIKYVITYQLSLKDKIINSDDCVSIKAVLNTTNSVEGTYWLDLFEESEASTDPIIDTIDPIQYEEYHVPKYSSYETTRSDIKLCEMSSSLKAFKAIGIIIFITKILVPIILIVIGSINLFKALKKTEDINKAIKSLAIKIVLGIVIFLIPTILNVIFNLLPTTNSIRKEFAGCLKCLTSPNCNTVGINQYEIVDYDNDDYADYDDNDGEDDNTTNPSANTAAYQPVKSGPPIIPKGNVVYSASSDTLKVNIVKKGITYYTYIWASNPYTQMLKGVKISNKSVVQKTAKVLFKDTISKYNLKNKIAVGMNASRGQTGVDGMFQLIIVDGKVVRNDIYQPKNTKHYTNNRYYYGISNTGIFKAYKIRGNITDEQRTVIHNRIINTDKVQNLFYYTAPLVKNGKAKGQSAKTPFWNSVAPRQALCQLDKNNYMIYTTIYNSTTGRKGLKLKTLAAHLQELGCVNAVNFDGGGSNTLFYKPSGTTSFKELVNVENRSMPDILVFTE